MNATQEIFAENWPEFMKIALSEEPYSSRVIYSILLLIVFVASLIGNILTCIVIYYDKSMHTATNYYLFNLAISDLLVTFPILIVVYQLLIQDKDIIEFASGGIFCKLFLCIHFIFVTLLWNNGILVMTALSIERYIAICFPMMLKGTPVWRRVGKIILAIWTIAILETLPMLWTLDVVDTEKTSVCFSLPTPTTKIVSVTLAVTTFIVPLIILIFVYTMIAFKVNKVNQNYKMKNTVINGYKRKNVNKLIALTVSFVVCWLPFFLLRTVMMSSDVQNLAQFNRWFTTIQKISMFNSWFTTVLNPLLFSLMSIKFRKALKMLWDRKIKNRYFQAKNSDTATNRHIKTAGAVISPNKQTKRFLII